MAAIDDIQLAGGGPVKDLVSGLLWRWIEDHGDLKVTLRIWIIRKTFRIRDLHSVFQLLLGPRPVFID